MRTIEVDFNCLDKEGRIWGIDQRGLVCGRIVIASDGETKVLSVVAFNEDLALHVVQPIGEPIAENSADNLKITKPTEEIQKIVQETRAAVLNNDVLALATVFARSERVARLCRLSHTASSSV